MKSLIETCIKISCSSLFYVTHQFACRINNVLFISYHNLFPNLFSNKFRESWYTYTLLIFLFLIFSVFIFPICMFQCESERKTRLTWSQSLVNEEWSVHEPSNRVQRGGRFYWAEVKIVFSKNSVEEMFLPSSLTWLIPAGDGGVL